MTRADPSDEEQLVVHATELADGIDAALPDWVRRCVRSRCADAGVEVDRVLAAAMDEAAERCRAQVGPEVRGLLLSDLDDQRSTPLALLRRAVRHPTEVLEGAGVPAPERDEFDRRAFPEDRYGLAPASFADLGPRVGELGLVWGAAKAHVHLARRRVEGRR